MVGKMNEIVKIIMLQINAKELIFTGFKCVYSDKLNSVTIKKGVKFLEVYYIESLDLYRIKKGIFKNFDLINIETINNVFFEDLKPIIEKHFNFEYVMQNFFRG
jgi:hypothetical protein